MKKCTYFLGNLAYTYQELVDLLLSNPDIVSVSDILYSKASKLELITLLLNELKKEYNFKVNNSLVDGEPIISEDGVLSILEFIDTPLFSIDGKQLTLKMDRDAYVVNRAKALEIEKKISLEEAEYQARLEIKNWDIIGEDSLLVHKAITDFDFRNGQYEFVLMLRGTKLEDAAADFYTEMLKTLKNDIYGLIKQGTEASKTIKNFNIKTEIESISKEVIGHIDYLLVDSLGDLHIVNFKTTTEKSSDWADAKKKKYMYLLAFLKLMLANKGFNVRNVTLSLVPLRINYNLDYSKIESVIPEPRREYTLSNNSKYIFGEYDRIAKHFIKSTTTLDGFSSEAINKANSFLSAAFPTKDIRAEGISKTAEDWISSNWRNKTGIVEVNKPDHAYDVIIPGLSNPIPIKSPENPTKNLEILDVVNKHMEMLDDGGSVVARRLLKDILNSYKSGFPNFSNGHGFSYSAQYLNNTLRKYFDHKVVDNNKIYQWEYIDNDVLTSANILLFRNRTTGLLDVISLSPYKLEVTNEFRGHKNILGNYLTDRVAGELFGGVLTADFGNIEAIRTMSLLNEVLPTISGEYNLGLLKVLTPVNNGKGRIFSIETLNKNYFSNIVKVVNLNNRDLQYTSNFLKARFIDPLEVLLLEYKTLVDSSKFSDSEKLSYADLGFPELESADTREAKVVALETLMKAITLQYKLLNTNTANIVKMMSDANPLVKNAANLYYLTAIAYSKYSGLEVFNEKELGELSSKGYTSNRVPNRNIRLVSSMFRTTADTISEKVSNEFTPIRKFIMDYYNKIGFSTVLSSVVGNAVSQFRNLYLRDLEGNITLTFKNPYTDNSLNLAEKEFLKKTLFTINKVRAEMLGRPFPFKDENDSDILRRIDEDSSYLWVPLEKASVATRRLTKEQWTELKNKVVSAFTNPLKLFQEYVEGIGTKLELEWRNEDVEAMSLRNKFLLGESLNTRNTLLNQHNPDFFETNVEHLLVDFLERHIMTTELNKMLIKSKCVLLLLELLGEESGEKLTKTMRDIDDFLKLNVFNLSIMEPTSLALIGVVQPIRSLTSKLWIAGNITSAFRDTFEGLWQNMMRTVNKYLTDLDAGSVGKAYKEVVMNSLTSTRSINIVNELCKIYRLSNLDIARISEGLKTTRGGIFNYEEWMYSTLRRPDFLNRMVLFVARCVKDGCWDAFDIKDGKLVYNWRKDKRFEAFAKGDTKNPKYSEQMSLYYSAIRDWNAEHPDNVIEYSGDLPMPYSNLQINSIKNIANSIYGAYDKSMKAKYENTALGWTFGVFSTWMNSIVNNYFTKPGIYDDAPLTLKLDTDESGENLLFFDKDGNITTENTGVPVYKLVPVMVQGILYTIGDTFKAFQNGGLSAVNAEIWTDPIQRKNLEKLFWDMIMWMLFAALFKLGVEPLYKDYKKNAKGEDIVSNALVEVLFKSSSRSYDGFKGPINIIEYLGNNTNPPVYTMPVKLMNDLGSFVFGDKTFGELATGSIAVLKTFQDTYKSFLKAVED